jgi:hypothetical protein
MTDITKSLDTLIDVIQHQPTFLNRHQSAEILGCAPSTIDKYVHIGKQINGQILLLPRENNGKYRKSEVLKFKLRIDEAR